MYAKSRRRARILEADRVHALALFQHDILDNPEAMSAPMGVPTQRLNSAKSSSKRQGPVAISRSAKIQQRNAAPIRTHSEGSSSRIAVVAGVLRRSNTTVAAAVPISGDELQKEKADMTPTGSRRIATNSRIKKDEQTKRDMYLAFINNALKAKSEVNFHRLNARRRFT